MKSHPAYASYIRTTRDAVIGALSKDGVHGLLLAALANGCNTYQDLRIQTGFSPGYLHRHLSQLIRDGQVETRRVPKSGRGQPQKLFFLTKKETYKAKK